MKSLPYLALFLTLLFGVPVAAQNTAKSSESTALMQFPAGAKNFAQPPELGLVPWRRDFEASLHEAKRSAKPVLLLFQEVPG
jgi:hypothetical protein